MLKISFFTIFVSLLISCTTPKDLKLGSQFKLYDYSYSIQNFIVIKVTNTGVLTNSTNGVVKNQFFSFSDLSRSENYKLIKQ